MPSKIWTKRSFSYNRAALIATAVCLWGMAAVSAYPGNVSAPDPEKAFNNARADYESGNFDKALSGYESILAAGLKSGNLYYNIGNCYLKKGAVGNAILSYERAGFFIPRDSDLLSNHRLAVSQMKQKDPAPRKSPLVLRLDNAFDLLTLGETIAVFAGLYYGFALLFILPKFVKRFRFVSMSASVLLFCITIAAIEPLAYKIDRANRSAVVVVPIADVKLEPQEGSSSHFPLYDGMKIYVLKERKGWCKVKRPDGKIGWAKSGDIALINP